MRSNLTIRRMYVLRLSDKEGGTWIEPALDQSWPKYTKLSWKLGVIYADHGLDITLTRFRTNWCISTSRTSFGSTKPGLGDFGELWDTLTAYAAGYGDGKWSA